MKDPRLELKINNRREKKAHLGQVKRIDRKLSKLGNWDDGRRELELSKEAHLKNINKR